MPPTSQAVHQLVPRLAWGDAVGNQVRYLRELLRGWGYASEIYAEQWDEQCRPLVRPAKDYPREADDRSALLIHHSFESRLVPLIARAPGRKAVVYHNVTPSRLFEGFERKVAEACTAAREELREMRPWVERAWAYSRFSAEELVAAGYDGVSVLPFAVDWRAFDVAPDPVLRAELDDGHANILFVGRAVPSKRVDDVLRVFTAYQRLHQPRSRLIVAGYLNRESPYGAYLYGLKEMLGAERVQFLGRVSAAQLSACFSVATAYLSMSRHEGFGVPLLEAMYRGVPVLAYGAAAVPETMGGAGVASLTHEPLEVARLLAVLERTPALRDEMLRAQRARVARLGQEAVAEAIRERLQPFLEGAPHAARSREQAPTVSLVCPGFVAHPDALESRLARRLARELPGARVLALDPNPQPVELAPRALSVEGLDVRAFTPDEPLPRDAARELPGSSALETALLSSRAPVVFLPEDSLVARETRARLSVASWGVRATIDPEQLEPTLSALIQALRATGALRAT
ncbi:Glycosyltransferase [Cystobacter fuscus DSM 2262]|uniref:Glycosyltransferase n=1 Tax=Cystobacter fuscus (strain ATCC 25194 / DSM 2262 / NBRC 100088 / M29) TaxID=1242864 RepID=S9NYU7_CYSF2|nr:glycosyltransferase [Cystobacter fuscus]EPX55177.1 Glycosyltransferase [Cystobacter fuscus DSM 2262]